MSQLKQIPLLFENINDDGFIEFYSGINFLHNEIEFDWILIKTNFNI